MQPPKQSRPPLLGSKEKPVFTMEQKWEFVETFYQYRIAEVYRQLKIPIYEQLLQKGSHDSKAVESVEKAIETLFKYACLNSKYHHREKMRFGRTPLLKYIGYDFQALKGKLELKAYQAVYEDLEDDEDSDKPDQNDPQHERHANFTEHALSNYKKKHAIKGRVFIVKGYQDLKNRLVDQHGWTENQDFDSLLYDFKFISKKKHIDYVNLLEGQLINHFAENKNITAKFGLARNIRNIVSMGKNHNTFFPRCYDVNDVSELECFYEDFKLTKIKSLLMQFVEAGGLLHEGQQPIIEMMLGILERESVSFRQKIDRIVERKPMYVTLLEWKVIEQFKGHCQKKAYMNEQLLQPAQKVLDCLAKKDKQFLLNIDNIWIVKPASMSRGRGIKTFKDLGQILDYVIGKEISWVVQKYIEKPLIIRKKKFDIRQWVLWTDFRPFRVWMYEQCYIRFCAETYTPDDLRNRKIHLTNNSVTKGVNQTGDGIEENMMSEGDFARELQDYHKVSEGPPKEDIFASTIKPQMRKIATETLLSVKENVVSRRNSLELFGFDFMVDQQYKVWLIEVNSSPTMEHSTKVTTALVQKGMADFADLVENYCFAGRNLQPNSSLYGGWKLIANL